MQIYKKHLRNPTKTVIVVMSPVLVLFSSPGTYPGRGVSRMGKRLGKAADLFSGQGLCLMVLCAAFLLGGAAGCLFSGAAGQATVAELTQYLTDYRTAAQSGNGYQHIIHDCYKENSKAEESVNSQPFLYFRRGQMTLHQWDSTKFNFPAV